jgi:hypothetical protein
MGILFFFIVFQIEQAGFKLLSLRRCSIAVCAPL